MSTQRNCPFVSGAARLLSLLAIAAGAAATASAQVTVRQYQVNFTENAPTIDGMIDGDEWSAAAAAEGNFLLLRSNPPLEDLENTRWQAMWDANNLYILTQSDYDVWSFDNGANDINAGIDFGADNLNIYFDPNVDGEENFPTNPETNPFDGVDGYQIAFNQWDGTPSFVGGVNNFLGGLFLEAHINQLFGNQARGQAKDAEGAWVPYGLKPNEAGDALVKDLPEGFAVSQTNGINGGLVEIAIPWSMFNGWLPEDVDNPDAVPADDITGLYHPQAPENGDTWFFNIARISSDAGNQLPVWNWTSSQFFASHPHGELVFQGAPDVDLVPGDVNGDRTVNLTDFNILKTNFGKTPAVRTEGDLDGDMVVSLSDFNILKANFGMSGSAAVPEPSTLLLAAMAVTGCCLAYRRRRG